MFPGYVHLGTGGCVRRGGSNHLPFLPQDGLSGIQRFPAGHRRCHRRPGGLRPPVRRDPARRLRTGPVLQTGQCGDRGYPGDPVPHPPGGHYGRRGPSAGGGQGAVHGPGRFHASGKGGRPSVHNRFLRLLPRGGFPHAGHCRHESDGAGRYPVLLLFRLHQGADGRFAHRPAARCPDHSGHPLSRFSRSGAGGPGAAVRLHRGAAAAWLRGRPHRAAVPDRRAVF